MFDHIGLGGISSLKCAAEAERNYVVFATVLCALFSVLLLPVIPLGLFMILILGGFTPIANQATALFINALAIITLIIFYIVAGVILWSSRQSIPVRLIRVFPEQKSTWTSKLAHVVFGVSLLIVSYVVLSIS